jgi:tetratricopeptide (TPR) repeat protein/GGDEF domain-containing protein
MLFLICLYRTGTYSRNVARGGTDGRLLPTTVIREPFETLTKSSPSVNLAKISLQIFPASADFYFGMANKTKLFRKAEKLFQKQKFDAAFETYLELFEEEPDNEAVLLNLVDLSLRFGLMDDSLRYSNLLADFYIERQDSSKAVVACRKILNAVPQDTRTLGKLALMLEQSGKATEAAHAFREAASAFRRNGEAIEALDCLQHLVNLEPDSLDAQTELAEAARKTCKPELAATALLEAADIARRNGEVGQWAELVDRAHQISPSNTEGCIAAAEGCLFRRRPIEAITLLEPISEAKPDDDSLSTLLCTAYLAAGEYTKAEPYCLKLFQANPESIGQTGQLITGLLSQGATTRAVELLKGIKEELYSQQGKKTEFLALTEQIYQADENNLQVLELLPPLYNELNRDGDLRQALARLFSLYLGGEEYYKAAETLENILDIDPYGAAHADRLLNLEGHIDAIWYKSIGGRIALPGVGRGLAHGLASELEEEPVPGTPAAFEGLIAQAEMYHRYHLSTKLEEVLKQIDRLYPGAHEDNPSLKELLEAADIEPTPAQHQHSDKFAELEGAAPEAPVEDLGAISSIAAIIHRQATPERVLSVAAEHLGRLVGSSRCWIATGPPDSSPLTAEYPAPGLASSDPDAALEVCAFLMQSPNIDPEGWPIDDVSACAELEPIAHQLFRMGIYSFLATPIMEKEQKGGLLLVEQCQTPRHWKNSERLLARTVASQVSVALNSTRLRRLVRSLAGTDPATGLLPRSAYLDCLLAEASRAEEQSRSLSVCLLEPVDAATLTRKLSDAGMYTYIQHAGSTVSSHVRQNDIAIRYGPYTLALCLPDTPLTHSRVVIEKLQAQLSLIRMEADISPRFRAVVSDLFLGPGFGAVDAVTEIVNRLETSMETLRKQSEAAILLSGFQG